MVPSRRRRGTLSTISTAAGVAGRSAAACHTVTAVVATVSRPGGCCLCSVRAMLKASLIRLRGIVHAGRHCPLEAVASLCAQRCRRCSLILTACQCGAVWLADQVASGATVEGTCGYGDMSQTLFPRMNVGAVSLVHPGAECGSCIQVRCLQVRRSHMSAQSLCFFSRCMHNPASLETVLQQAVCRRAGGLMMASVRPNRRTAQRRGHSSCKWWAAAARAAAPTSCSYPLTRTLPASRRPRCRKC